MRILVNLNSVAFIYPEMKDYLFKGVSFTVYEGEKIGLLGVNGSGKTTLLELVKGDKEPEEGNIQRFNCSIMYLKQEEKASGAMSVVEYMLEDEEIVEMFRKLKSMERDGIKNPLHYADLLKSFEEKGGFEKLKQIRNTLLNFGFSENTLQREVDSLSGGERRILKIASLLSQHADLYLLDEPTNFLDREGIEFLKNTIKRSKSAFIIVSHDRWFLDKTVSRILEIERGCLRAYSGNYSVFIATKEREFKEKLRKKEKIEKEIERLKKMERNYKTWAGRKEKEKIGAGDKGFISHKASKLAKKAILAKTRREKRIQELEREKPWIEKIYNISFEDVEVPSGVCLAVTGLVKSFKEKTLFSSFSFSVNWGEKVSIDGPNGSGKTTLLRILLGDIEADEGEVVWHKLSKPRYLPQSGILFNEEMKVYQLFDKELWEKARTLLGCLKVRGDSFFKKLKELSEGQKRKVELVKIILDEPNVLILDEPTTHLDYYTVELLEKALLEFKGTLILVSHDRYLVERVCERRIPILEVSQDTQPELR